MHTTAQADYIPRCEMRRSAQRPFWKIWGVLMGCAVGLMILGLVLSTPKSRPPPRSQRARQVVAAPKRPEESKPTGPRAQPPQFTVPGGVYTNACSIELKAGSPGAVIRFTLNGSEPTAASPVYAGPLTISNTTLVKAKCFDPNLAPSPTATQTYTMLDESAVGFSSNLPLVIISAFGQRIQHETPVPISTRFIRLTGQRSSLLGPADYEGRGEIKRRGYSSLRFPKQSFTLKTVDGSSEKVKAGLFGLPADSDWVLYAPYSDKTLMRDVLAYEMSNKMGRYAPRTRFVEVFINRAGNKLTRRDYAGVYVLIEKIKRGKNRVNIEKLEPEDNTEPNITGGYIFKRDHDNDMGGGPFRRSRYSPFRPSDEEVGFTTSRGIHLFYVEPKEREITAAQSAWLQNYLNQFERVLYGRNFKSPTEGYSKFLDADSFIDHFWMVEMSKNIDGFRYSCFMHKDRGGKIKVEPMWDWNLSFGNADYYEAWVTEGWYHPLLREREISWYRRLIQDPDFAQKQIDRWADLRKEVFAPENILKRVDELAALLEESQRRNYQRWPILGHSVEPNWYVGRSYDDELNWMKKWIKARITWIDAQFLAAPTSHKESPEKLTLRAGVGKIYYTADGSDPRLPGGALSPKAQPYSRPVTLEPSAQVVARVQQDGSWSSPVVLKLAGDERRSR
jgi:hypothetical protein